MQKPFVDLRERLLRAGVAPRHVRRYVKELTEHLADVIAEERRLGRNQSDAESAAFARLGGTDDLAKAMLDQPQLRSWSARAPWATLGLAPVACLAVAYFVACFILWSGWKIFLPASNSPFNAPIAGPIYGLENVYFSNRQADLFQRTDSDRMGHCHHRSASKTESALANNWLGRYRDTRQLSESLGNSFRRGIRRTCQHEFRSRSRQWCIFRRLSLPGSVRDCDSALRLLENGEDILALRRIVVLRHMPALGMSTLECSIPFNLLNSIFRL